MKYRSTLILLVAVVIVAIVAHSLSQKPTSEELRQQRKRLLPGAETDDIQVLEIQQDESRIVCRRDGEGGDWRIVSPVEARADQWTVRDVVRGFLTTEPAWRSPEAAADQLAQYGLEPPGVRVTLGGDGEEARTWVLLIGKPTGAAESVYVAVEGRKGVYAVSKDVTERARVTVAELRSKRLAPRISVFDLERVRVAARERGDEPGFEAECVKAGEAWELNTPFLDLADGEAIEGLAEDLYSHRLSEDDFVTDDPADRARYGLDTPDLSLTLQTEEQVQHFAFACREEDGETACYALNKDESAVVRVPEDLFEDLRKGPEDLRERDLADIKVPAVAGVHVSAPGRELVLERTEEGWRIAGEMPAQADGSVIEQVLRDLSAAQVDRFVADEPQDVAPYGLAEGQATLLAIRDEEGETAAEIVFGKPAEGNRVHAMRKGYPSVFLVNRERFYGRIARGRLAFLDRQVASEPPGEAVRVRVERAGEEFECALEDEAWRLVRPVSGPADTRAVRRVLDGFAGLRAAAFAAEHAEDLAPYGLESPAATVTVTYAATPTDAEAEEPPERRVTLHLGAATTDPAEGSYAKLSGDERVFVLPPYRVEELRAGLASRTIAEVHDLTAVTLRRGKESERFAYDSGEGTWLDADGKELPEERASAVRALGRLLGNFRALRVADYVERSARRYGFDEPYLTVEMETETARGKKVVIGAETEGGRYAAGPATDFVLVASPADVATLTAPLEPAGGDES